MTAAPPRSPQPVRIECSMAVAAQTFGLTPTTKLPIQIIGGRPLYLSGWKRPGQPWVLRLRTRP
jgi:hypothetical protein